MVREFAFRGGRLRFSRARRRLTLTHARPGHRRFAAKQRRCDCRCKQRQNARALFWHNSKQKFATILVLPGRHSRSAGGINPRTRAGLLRARSGHLRAKLQDGHSARRGPRRGHFRGGGEWASGIRICPHPNQAGHGGTRRCGKDPGGIYGSRPSRFNGNPRCGRGRRAGHRAHAFARAGSGPAPATSS